MKTDRELLELAAKVAGITGWKSKYGYWNVKDVDGKDVVCCASWPLYDPTTGQKLDPTFADAISELNWNPLEDDGDALRLAVNLGFDLITKAKHDSSYAGTPNRSASAYCYHDDDPYAATRRAIVRTAAAIGELS